MNENKCPYCGRSKRVWTEVRTVHGDKNKSTTTNTPYIKKEKEDVIRTYDDDEIKFCCEETKREYNNNLV